jgi:ProP effector
MQTVKFNASAIAVRMLTSAYQIINGFVASIRDWRRQKRKPAILKGRRRRRRRPMHSKAAIAQISSACPLALFTNAAKRRPLKIGIADDIAAQLDGALQPQDLRRALGHYANSIGYLKSFHAGAARLDLDGNIAGTVTEAEADHARVKLAAVLARRQPKPKPAPAAQQRLEAEKRADSQPRLATSLAQHSGRDAGRRDTGAREQRAQPIGSQRDGLAELRAAAARRREVAG